MGGSQTEVWYAIGNETTSDGVITAQLDSGAIIFFEKIFLIKIYKKLKIF